VVRLLAAEWNPIGFDVPPDEYDCVADPVGATLRDGLGPAEVAAVLGARRMEHFGCEADADSDLRVATALVEWYSATVIDIGVTA
jgi:hypothetical protein